MRSSVLAAAALSIVFGCKLDDEKTASGQAALDGTWDITAAGGDAIGPSSMTINGSTIDGELSETDDSYVDGQGQPCTSTTDTEFSIAVQGENATATFTFVSKFSSADCGDASTTTSTITATRESGSETGDTVYDGKWTIFNSDNEPFAAVTILNLVVSAWENAQKEASEPPVLKAVIANGATNAATTKKDLTFAARKR